MSKAVLGAMLLCGALLATTASTASASYSSVVLGDGPVGYWRFGGAPGSTTMTDSSGTGNTGTFLNGVTLGQPGALSNDPDTAASFDGVNDIGRVPDANSLDVGSMFTLEGWIKRSTTAKSQELYNKGGNGFEMLVMGAANGNQVWLRKANVTTVAHSAGGVPADGRYHYVVAQMNGTTPKIYIDGQPDTVVVTAVQTIQNTTFPIDVGTTASAQANYDEFALYPRVLTAAEVLEHYQAGTDIPPTAVADSATVVEDSGASAINVLANDTDPDGGPKSIASVTQPANGTVVITGGGTGLTYAPSANYCNSPPGTSPSTFTYTLTPGGSTTTVSVTVTCVDDRPVAVNDSATVVEDSNAGAVTVLANDTDPDGGPKSIASVTQPANGVVVITGGGTGLTYAPNANYCNSPPGTAPDTFTYTLTPGGSSATVSMTVTCVDDPPVAVNDTKTVTQDSGAHAVDVLANDTDVDGGPKSVSSVTQPAHGSVVVTGGGTGVSYTPAAGYCNSGGGSADTFTYALAPGVSTATVSVTVSCLDIAPTAVADSATVVEDSGASAVAVLANDTDPDGGSKSIASVTQPANGVVVITGGGTGLTYAPNANYCNSPPGTTPDTFTYTLSPGASSATVSMTVTCVDDPPVAVNDSPTVLEDPGATAVSVLANDTDIDGGPKTISSVTQPTHGAVVITGGGTGLTYQPSANYCNSPPGTTPDTFTYTLSGGSTATVSMTVTCVNDAPTATDDTFDAASSAVGNTALVVNDPTDGPPSVAGPKKSITGDILANDTDPDGPNALAVTAGTFATHDGGTVVIESDGDFTFTPAAGTSCSDTSDFFDYTVSDGNTPTPGTDVGRVTISITGCVWYVNNNAAGNSGTSTAPFDTLAQAQSASGTGDTIFVFDGDGSTTGYTAGIDLKTNQRLLGEAANLQVGSDLLFTGVPANRPTITDSGADVVKLASGDTVRGIDIDPQGTGGGIAGGDGTAPNSITGGTIDDVRIIDTGTAGTQPGLELDTTAGTFNISDLTVDNSAATGTTSGSIGVRLNNAGTVNFAASGTIAITTTGAKALDAAGTSLGAGSVFDSIASTNSGSGGLSLVNTTGTVSLGDGAGTDVNLTTTSGSAAAFRLSNAANVTVPAAGTANVSATGGPAVDATGSAGASLSFDAVTSTGSASTGIHLTGLGAGTFGASSSSAITDASGIDFDLDGGTGAVTYDGTIDDDVGQLVRVQNTTGGTKDFNGKISDGGDGDGSGIAVTSNTGATIRFDGGLTLSTGANPAFAATGGGTLAVTDPAGATNNTIATTTGTALNISNTTVSADGVTLERVSSSGAANGILLSNTGSSGGLTVTGNGGTCTNADTSGCSGGQIANATGADDSGTTPVGTGIVLNNTLSPSLTRMWIHDASNYAIRGTSVAGFTLANSVINGTNGNNGTTPFDDSSVWFDNLTGSAAVSNSFVSGGYEDNFRVANTSGSLNRLTMTSDTIGDNSAAGGNDGVSLESATTAGQLEATVQSSTFTGAGGDLLQYSHNGSGTGDLVLTGNAFSNNHPGIATGGGGLTLTNGGTSGATTMSITGANTFRDAVGNALTIAKSTGTSTQTGTFSGNMIGVNGVANSGSAEGDGLKLQTLGQGTESWTVTNNTIRGYNNMGVEVVAGGSASAQGGSVNATITGNTIDQPGNTAGTLALPKNGVHLNIGTVPGDTYAACAVIGGAGALANLLGSAGAPGLDPPNPPNGGEDVRLRQRQSTTIRLPGYAGSPTDTAAVQAFVAANNPSGPPSVISSVNSPPGGGFTGTGSSCP